MIPRDRHIQIRIHAIHNVTTDQPPCITGHCHQPQWCPCWVIATSPQTQRPSLHQPPPYDPHNHNAHCLSPHSIHSRCEVPLLLNNPPSSSQLPPAAAIASAINSDRHTHQSRRPNYPSTQVGIVLVNLMCSVFFCCCGIVMN